MRCGSAVTVIALSFVLTLLGIWWPQWRHYYVGPTSIPDAALSALRASPSDDILRRLSSVSFEPTAPSAGHSQITARANDVALGYWTDADFGTRRIHIPFDANDLDAGWPAQQLRLASLSHVTALLEASDASGDVRYLKTARDIVNAWADYERGAWVPRGFLWNDHAIAERVLVLTEYWRQFRGSELYTAESARRLLEFVDRSGRLLASPEHYTARTNHGFMQNLALLHIATAFPALPDSRHFREVALDRLSGQMKYYQSPEGVILEHSAGYHLLGTQLISALRLYEELRGEDFNLRVNERFAGACQFLTDIMRPDGSLPLIGDTAVGSFVSPCDNVQDRHIGRSADLGRLDVFPASGFAVNWVRSEAAGNSPAFASQTVIAWGNFATRAHKHDDEMSFTTWTAGSPFLTGAGYFPYGHLLQRSSLSWRGSNSPHVDGDSLKESRSTRLLASGHRGATSFVELERRALRANDRIRRQILILGSNRWLVIDSRNVASGKRLETLWTLYPGWEVSAEGVRNAYTIKDSETHLVGSVQILSSSRVQTTPMSATDSPFAGWVALAPAPDAIKAATSIESYSEPGALTATLWSVGSERADRMMLADGSKPDHWKICLDGSACAQSIERRDDGIHLREGLDESLVRVEPAQDPRIAVEKINASYARAASRFPTWRDVLPWRKRFSEIITVLLAGQVAVLLVGWMLMHRFTQRVRMAAAIRAANALMAVAWMLGGALIVFGYFDLSLRF